MNNRLVPKAKWGIFTKSFWTGKKSTPKIDPFDAALEHAYSVLDSENKRLDNFRALQKADMEWNTDMSRIDNMLKDAYSTLQDLSLNPYRKPTPTITASPEDAVADDIFTESANSWMNNFDARLKNAARQRRLSQYATAAKEAGLDANAIDRILYLAGLNRDGIYGPDTQAAFANMLANGSPNADGTGQMAKGYISGLGWYDPNTAQFYQGKYEVNPEAPIYGSNFKEAAEAAGIPTTKKYKKTKTKTVIITPRKSLLLTPPQHSLKDSKSLDQSTTVDKLWTEPENKVTIQYKKPINERLADTYDNYKLKNANENKYLDRLLDIAFYVKLYPWKLL